MKTNASLSLLASALLLSACVTTQPTSTETTTRANQADSQSLNLPQSIAFNKSQYTLINQDQQEVNGSEVFTYQYTTNGQTINNWQSIISIAHNTKDSNPEAVLKTMVSSLENTTPKPIYDIKFDPDSNTALAQIIYQPQDNYPAYEASTWILDFGLTCPGYASIQFAVRLPADATNEQVIQTNNALTQYMVSNFPKVDCAQ